MKKIKFLPVTNEERRSWTAYGQSPMSNRHAEPVNFHVSPKPKDTWYDHKDGEFENAACYAAISPNYHDYTITCKPRGDSTLSEKEVFEFFQTLTEHDIIPEKVELWAEGKKMFARIPKGCGNPHQVYAALTAYRWLDSHERLVWEFLQLHQQEIPRHPAQILTYLADKYIKEYPGHHFLPIGQYGGAPGGSLNPLAALAIKLYFDPQDQRGKKDFESPGQQTVVGIANISKSITELSGKTRQQNWQTIQLPTFMLLKPIDILHPSLTKLFEIPRISKGQIHKILSELFTKEEK